MSQFLLRLSLVSLVWAMPRRQGAMSKYTVDYRKSQDCNRWAIFKCAVFSLFFALGHQKVFAKCVFDLRKSHHSDSKAVLARAALRQHVKETPRPMPRPRHKHRPTQRHYASDSLLLDVHRGGIH